MTSPTRFPLPNFARNRNLLTALLLAPSLLMAAPTAVNDTYTIAEDTQGGGTAQSLINSNFEPGAPVSFTMPTAWKYLDTLPGTATTYPVDESSNNWKSLAFDFTTSTVAGWKDGTLPIQGGGVDGITATSTLLGITGGGGENTVHTYLFRANTTLNAAQAAAANTWVASVLVDDGCIIYINGVEAGRQNYPTNVAVAPNAVVGGNGGSETAFFSIPLSPAPFVVGQNVIAVEVHQNATNSSDVGIAMTLSASVGGDPTGGFTGVDDPFFSTALPDYASQATGAFGFNGGGGIRALGGAVFAFGGNAVSAASSGWRKTFTTTTAGPVQVSVRYRLQTTSEYDAGEYVEALMTVNGTYYGNNTNTANSHQTLSFFVGDGNGGAARDSGWQTYTTTIPSLAAGTHTLVLGGYQNRGTVNFQGGVSESFTVDFDDVSVQVTGAASLVSNDTFAAPGTAAKASDPANGTVTVNADGSFLYIPNLNYNGTDSFTYTVTDGTGTSDPATATITITPVNDAPVAVADAYTTDEDTPLTIPAPGVLGNDTDIDSASLTAVGGVPPTKGIITGNGVGGFIYTPNANATGTDTFTYAASDGALQSALAVVTITINPLPDVPLPQNDSYKVIKNTTLTVNQLTTVGQATTKTLILAAPETASNAAAQPGDLWTYLDNGTDQGTAWRALLFNDTAWKTGRGELGYGDAGGTELRAEYTLIEDDATPGYDSASSNRYVTTYFRKKFEVEDRLRLSNLAISLLRDDGAVIYLNGNVIFADNGLTDQSALTYTTLANNASNAQESTHQPVTLLAGTAGFLLDGENQLAVEIHQNTLSSTDVSFDLGFTASEVPYVGVAANDIDPEGDAFTIALASPPSVGTLTLNPDGTFIYTPPVDFTGTTTFTYTATDSTGTSAPATVTLNVTTGPNQGPAGVADSFTVTEDTLFTSSTLGVLANDTDPENDPLQATLVTGPTKGVLILNTNGSFTYTPNANVTGSDTFTYRAIDTVSLKQSSVTTVTLTINAVNDAPVAVANSYAADPGVTLTVNAANGVLNNDTDIENSPLTAVLVSTTTNGTLALQATGAFTYTPNVGFGGVDSFTYNANDGTDDSNMVTVTISVNGRPVAVNDSYNATEDTQLTISSPGVLGNDTDPENQALTATIATQPASGSVVLAANGGFVFTPALNFAGDATFTYTVSDGVRTSLPATVTITVAAVNDAPVATADNYGVQVNATTNINVASGVLRNDTDAEGTPLTVTLVANATQGTVTLNANGSFSYTPVAGYSGTDSFTYTATDGQATSAVTTVTLTVSTDLGTVVISEVMFNPPGSAGATEEFIELHNYGDFAVDVSQWTFTKGVDLIIPPGTLIAAGGYLVIPANSAAFAAKYPTATNVLPLAWGTSSSLANSGETIRLRNALGEIADEIAYSSEGDWATRRISNVWDASNTGNASPDNGLDTDPSLEWWSDADPNVELRRAGGHSLQLRNAELSNNQGQNWATAIPTPGAANTSVATTNLAPIINNVKHSPAVPTSTQQVTVTAELKDELETGLTATAHYRSWAPSGQTPNQATFTAVAMLDDGLHGDGAAGDGVFGAILPAAAVNTVVEFYVSASDSTALSRTWPAPTVSANGLTLAQDANCLYQVDEAAWNDQHALYRLVMTGADNYRFDISRWSSSSNEAPNCTFIVRRGQDYDIRYQASLRIRGNSSRNDTPRNWRLDIPKDAMWNDRSAFVLNAKYSYSQVLGSKTFELAGEAVERANAVGVWLNGTNHASDGNLNRTYGLYADLIPRGGEVVDSAYPYDNDGNIYGKIRGSVRWGTSTLPTIGASGWAVGGYVNEGYWKQSNASANDWTDLHDYLVALNTGSTIADFHQTTASTIDHDQWARWWALTAIINHAETNPSNGDDDDYSVYFGADRRAKLLAHDLDTCFYLQQIGLGDENAPADSTIYQGTASPFPTGDTATLPQMDKFYRNPVTGRKFKAELKRMMDTVFAKPQFDALVDSVLPSTWLGATYFNGNTASPTGDAIRTHLKAYMDLRRTTIATFLPTEFTATTTLPVQSGYPRTTSATELGALGGKIDPARTANVTVNGVAGTTNPYGSTGATDNTWSAPAGFALIPGLNKLTIVAKDAQNVEIARQVMTIWYDDSSLTAKSGTLATETWTAAGGPYNLTANVVVPNGATLTIEPGTSVYLATGANVTVAAGGKITALGTSAAPIRFTREPGGTGNWGGITINGTTAQPAPLTQLNHVIFENNGSVAVHAQQGANVELTNLTFTNTGVAYLSLDGSSFYVADTIFPATTAAFEPVHGSGGIVAGGRGLITNCTFGKAQGYNDVIDFTGGKRPSPILHIMNCSFMGSDDDILDLDGTDAWIEGNVFAHAHRNGSPDSASAVSGGNDNGNVSQVTVLRNMFYDCDQAVTMKQGNSAVVVQNTIAHITKTGGEDTASGVVNFADEGTTIGAGMLVENNVIWDAESLTRNYTAGSINVIFNNNILPTAWSGTGSGNRVVDPLLGSIATPGTATIEQIRAALTIRECSPALGTGYAGNNLGASIPAGPLFPVSSTNEFPTSVQLSLGGTFTPTGQAAWTWGYTAYTYTIDATPDSPEAPLSTPLSLSEGNPLIGIRGKDDSGEWRSFAPVQRSIRTSPNTLLISEILANNTSVSLESGIPYDLVELHNTGSAPLDISGYSLTDDPALPGRYTFPVGTSIAANSYIVIYGGVAPVGSPNMHLGFDLNKGGETLSLYRPNALVTSSPLQSVPFGPQLANMSISHVAGGFRLSTPTLGAPNTGTCDVGDVSVVKINEWLASNDYIVTSDFVELYNPTAKPINLADAILTKDPSNALLVLQNADDEAFRLVANSFIPANGFILLHADGAPADGNDHLSFTLSRSLETVALLSATGAKIDQVILGPAREDESQGRTVDGGQAITYQALPTPGFSNGTDLSTQAALRNGLRITEVMYNPPGSSGADYIELQNTGNVAIDLFGVTFSNGIDFTFGPQILQPGAYVVIANNQTAFTAQFPSVTLAGVFSTSSLSNGGERVRYELAEYPLGILDFNYSDSWYPVTDGQGASLQIVNANASPNTWDEATSWQAALPSPGAAPAFGVLAGLDQSATLPSAVNLSGSAFPGIHVGTLTVQWSQMSGPGTTSFTAPTNGTTQASFTAPGTYVLTLTASIAGNTASDSLTVTVADSYAAWAARNSLVADPAADTDGDGMTNLLEYALGSNPTVQNAAPQPEVTANGISLTYTIPNNIDPNVVHTAEVSENLIDWSSDPSDVQVDLISSGPGGSTYTATDLHTQPGGDVKHFLRLKVELTPQP